MNEDRIDYTERYLRKDLITYATIHDVLKGKVECAMKKYIGDDEVVLKANGVTGWLGELYAALFFDGTIIPENESYDIRVGENRVEVKTRRAVGDNWRLASTVTEREKSCPTHLVFVKLNGAYELEAIYRFDWTKEFKEKLELKSDTIDEKTGWWKRQYKFSLKKEFEDFIRFIPNDGHSINRVRLYFTLVE